MSGRGPTVAPASSSARLKPGKGAALWRDLRSLLGFVAALFGVQSVAAQQHYIPSESMMPGLLKGDRLLVSKYAYGWSWASVPFHLLPETRGRVLGRTPRRGDIVTLVPAGRKEDWIKRVIGLPGDTVGVVDGQVILNGRPVPRVERDARLVLVDANAPCDPSQFPGARVRGPGGRMFCRLPIYRETLPDGVRYDTVDMVQGVPGDDVDPVRVPAGHLFLMGDNRDNSADSRFSSEQGGLGPVPWGNVGGRAEFVTFSLDGSAGILNPLSWWRSLRGERAGQPLRPAETRRG